MEIRFAGWGSAETPADRRYWRDAGVVDRAALEMRCTGNCTGGSNPSLSANNFEKPCKSMIYGAFFFATYKNTYKK